MNKCLTRSRLSFERIERAVESDGEEATMDLDEVLGLKASAKGARDDEDWETAVNDLEDALDILHEMGLNTSDVLIAEIADTYGMLGGVERRWALASGGTTRTEHLAKSVQAYDRGFEFESQLSGGNATTYTRINRLVGRVLVQPSILAGEHDGGNFRQELEEAERLVVEQIDGSRVRDPWAYCDLLTVQLLSGTGSASSTLGVLIGLRPPPFVYTSTLATLRPLAEAAASSRPQLAIAVERLQQQVGGM
jgi:hypothetical protein